MVMMSMSGLWVGSIYIGRELVGDEGVWAVGRIEGVAVVEKAFTRSLPVRNGKVSTTIGGIFVDLDEGATRALSRLRDPTPAPSSLAIAV